MVASHVLPVVPVNVLWPKPRSSLSASSVLSRITSPRSEPPNRYQKSLPVKPRSQSLIGQSQPHPTHLIPSSPDGNTTNKRKTFLTMNDKVVYTGNNQVTTGRGFSSIMKASIVRIRHSFVQLGHIKANHHYSTTPHKQQQQQQQNDQQKQRRRAISTSESRPALSVPLLLVYVDKALLTQKVATTRNTMIVLALHLHPFLCLVFVALSAHHEQESNKVKQALWSLSTFRLIHATL